MKDTTYLYKDINGNGIKQLDIFIDRYTLLLGIHVKYIIFILLLLILYMLSDTDFSAAIHSSMLLVVNVILVLYVIKARNVPA